MALKHELLRLFSKPIKLIPETILKKQYEYIKDSEKDYIYERPIEYSFALNQLNKHHKKKVLDVGSGKSPFPAILNKCGFLTTAIDEKEKYWGWNSFNQHYFVISDDICNSKLQSNSFDAVTCISVLEHISSPEKAVREMTRLLRKNGIIILSFPFTYDEYCPNVYDLKESDSLSSNFNYFAQSFSQNKINKWKKDNKLKEIDRKYFKGWTGKYWRTGDRIDFPKIVNDKGEANGACICLMKK